MKTKYIFQVMWLVSITIIILFNEYIIDENVLTEMSLEGYQKTFFYKTYNIGYFNVCIVDGVAFLFLFILGLCFLADRNNNNIIPSEMRYATLFLGILIVSCIVGTYRITAFRIHGLLEFKMFLIFILFIALSFGIFSGDNDLYYIYIPAVLILFRLSYEIYRYCYFPNYDVLFERRTAIPRLALMFTPVFWGILFYGKTRLPAKLLLLTVIALTMACTILSYSRSYILICIVAGILFILYHLFIRKGYKRKIGLVLLSIVILTGAVAAVIYNKYDTAHSYMFWVENDGTHSFSNRGHWDDIRRGIMFIKNAPLLGMGVGGELPAFESATFSSVIHNEFLHFWVNFGLMGAILWCYIFIIITVKTIVSFIKLSRQNRLEYYYFVLFAAIPAILVQGTIFPPFYFSVGNTLCAAMILAIQLKIIRKAQAPVSLPARPLEGYCRPHPKG